MLDCSLQQYTEVTNWTLCETERDPAIEIETQTQTRTETETEREIKIDRD